MRWCVLLFASSLMFGCSAYEQSYQFTPQPAMLELRGAEVVESEFRPLATIVGVRKASDDLPEPMVEVRLLLENLATRRQQVSVQSLSLTSADLERFGEPRYLSDSQFGLAPDESARVTALFPFPAGKKASEVAMGGLNLRATFNVAGQRVSGSATFDREYPYRYYYPGYYYSGYYYPRGYGVGVGYGSRWGDPWYGSRYSPRYYRGIYQPGILYQPGFHRTRHIYHPTVYRGLYRPGLYRSGGFYRPGYVQTYGWHGGVR